MQIVVSSFESVAGLSSATPYIPMALKSVSKHFRCLKNSISDQLKRISEALGDDLSIPLTTSTTSTKADTNMAKMIRCMDQSFLKNNNPGSGTTELVEPQQHVWRPQRGLPERAVAILKAWLFEHFLHPYVNLSLLLVSCSVTLFYFLFIPKRHLDWIIVAFLALNFFFSYPTDTDKHMLASQTGLSRNQVGAFNYLHFHYYVSRLLFGWLNGYIIDVCSRWQLNLRVSIAFGQIFKIFMIFQKWVFLCASFLFFQVIFLGP